MLSDIPLREVQIEKKQTASELENLMRAYYTPGYQRSISPVAGCPTDDLGAIFVYNQDVEKYARHSILWNMARTYVWSKFIEWIARAYVYTRPPINSVIPNSEFLYYLKRIYVSASKGLVGYLFAPVKSKTDAPNILAFKGSDFHPAGTAPISCILADLENRIGYEDFRSLEPELQAIDRAAEGQRKMMVCGHSLGGVAAQRFCEMLPDLVGELWTFNSPGIKGENGRFENKSARGQKRDERLLPAFPPKQPEYNYKFTTEIFVTEEDIVDRVNGIPLTGISTKINICTLGFDKSHLAHVYLTHNNPSGFDLTGRIRTVVNDMAVENYLESRYSKPLEFGRGLLRFMFAWALKWIAKIPQTERQKTKDAVLAMDLGTGVDAAVTTGEVELEDCKDAKL